VLFGLFTTGLLRLPWLDRDARYHGQITGGGPTGAFLLGLAFAFGWTPCIGPVLGAILTVSAVSATASDGVLLLAVYSVGLGVPFVLAAIFTDALKSGLPRLRRAGRYLQVVAGIVMMAMGVAMMTGQMTRLAFWLLGTFPGFGAIG
jgi:cytochrome c-type biogenesis protein